MGTKGYIVPGNSSNKPKAYLSVTFPEDSVCTATHDGKGKTLTAKDTSGFFVFNLPYIGEWTVSITNGTKTVSQTVDITFVGQNLTIDLEYWDGVIYNAGVEYEGGINTVRAIGGSSMSTGTPTATATKNSTYIRLNCAKSHIHGYAGYACAASGTKIDLSKYSKVAVNLSTCNTSATLMVTSSSPYSTGTSIAWGSTLASATLSATGVTALDVSNVDSGYVCVYLTSGSTESRIVDITKMYCIK